MNKVKYQRMSRRSSKAVETANGALWIGKGGGDFASALRLEWRNAGDQRLALIIEDDGTLERLAGEIRSVLAGRKQAASVAAMKQQQEAEEARLLATTCFHCGEPALPRTHGLDPRCERHRDV